MNPMKERKDDIGTSSVSIGRFAPSDESGVHTLLREGLRFLAPRFITTFLSTKLAISLLCGFGFLVWYLSRNILFMLAIVLAIPASHYAFVIFAMEQYIKSSIREDLTDIPSCYQKRGGEFFVARTNDNKVVGCVGIQKKKESICELRRMYVNKQFRGQRIASKLTNHVVEFARREGFSSIILVCSSVQFEAHGLYQKCGFVVRKQTPASLLFHGVKFYDFILKLKKDDDDNNNNNNHSSSNLGQDLEPAK